MTAHRIWQVSILCLSLCVAVLSYGETIYKSVDAQGNVTYSDKPSSNAQPVSLMPISVTASPAVSAPADTPVIKKPVTSISYKTLEIQQPQNDATIWDNNGNFSVQVNLEPALVAGDTLQILLDGKVVASSSNSTSFNITGIDRGTHIVQAQIIDPDQKVVKVSNSITIYLHRTIAKKKNLCTPGNCPLPPKVGGKGNLAGQTQKMVLLKPT